MARKKTPYNVVGKDNVSSILTSKDAVRLSVSAGSAGYAHFEPDEPLDFESMNADVLGELDVDGGAFE